MAEQEEAYVRYEQEAALRATSWNALLAIGLTFYGVTDRTDADRLWRDYQKHLIPLPGRAKETEATLLTRDGVRTKITING